MATEGKKLMEEIYDQFLVCKICFESYKNPKTLNCLHVFCCECLEKHNESELERSSYRYMIYVRSVSCPICRKKTDLPTGGVRRLPDNFLVSNLTEIVDRRRPGRKLMCQICQSSSSTQATSKCLECSKLLCKKCVQTHKKTNVTQHHSLFDVEVEKDVMCKVHQDESVRFYCEPCETCVCVLCTFQEHKGHDVSSFTDGMRKYGGVLQELIESCKDRITVVKTNIDLINKCEGAIKVAEDNIRDTTINLISAIRSNERKLMSEVRKAFGNNTEEFIDSKQNLQDILDNLLSTCNLTDIIIKDNSLELLLLKKDIQNKLQQMLEVDVPSPPEKVDRSITFVPGSVKFGQLKNGEEEDVINVDGDNKTDDEDKNDTAKCASVFIQTDPAELRDSETTMDKLVIEFNAAVESQTDGVQMKHEDCMTDATEVSHRGTMPCSVYMTNTHTMTEPATTITKKCQTEHVYGKDKSTCTQQKQLVDHNTNTPVTDQCSRSTCTVSVNMKDQDSDTKGLIFIRDTSVNTNRKVFQEQGSLTDAKTTSTKQVSTAVETADKLTNTSKSVNCSQGTMTEIVPQSSQIVTDNTIETVFNSAETQVASSDLQITTAKACQTRPFFTEQSKAKKVKVVHRAVGSDRIVMKNRFTMTNVPVTHSDTMTDPVFVYDTPKKEPLLVDKSESTATVETCDNSTTTNHGVNVMDAGVSTTRASQVDCSTATGGAYCNDACTQMETIISKEAGTSMPVIRMSDQSVHAQTNVRDKSTVTTAPHKSSRDASCLVRPSVTSRETEMAKTVMRDTGITTTKTQITDKCVGESHAVADAHTMTPIKHFKDTSTMSDKEVTQSVETSTVHVETRENDTNTVPRVMTDTATMTRLVLSKDSSTAMTKPYAKSRATCTVAIKTKDSTTSTSVATSDMCVGNFTHQLNDKSTGIDYVGTTDANVCTETVDLSETATQMETPFVVAKGTSTDKVHHATCSTNTPVIIQLNKETMKQPQTQESSINTDMLKVVTNSTMTTQVKSVERGHSPVVIPGLYMERATSTAVCNKTKATETVRMLQKDVSCQKVFQGVSVNTMTFINVSEKGTSTTLPSTQSQSTATIRNITVESGTGTGYAQTFDKETGTPQVHLIHKNVSTDNMAKVDKQTNTSNIASAYRQLVAPRVVMKSKATSTVPPVTRDMQTSTIKPNKLNAGLVKNNDALQTNKDQENFCKTCQSLSNTTTAMSNIKLTANHNTHSDESKYHKTTSEANNVYAENTCQSLSLTKRGVSMERCFEDRGTSPIKVNGDSALYDLSVASYKPPVMQSDGRIATVRENKDKVDSRQEEKVRHHSTPAADEDIKTAQTDKPWASEPNLGGTTFVTVGRRVPLSFIMKIDKETNTAAIHQRNISTETLDGAARTEDKGTSTEKSPPVIEGDPVGGKINECISKLHNVTKRLQCPSTTSQSSSASALITSIAKESMSQQLPMASLSPVENAAHDSPRRIGGLQLPRFSPFLTRRRLKSMDTSDVNKSEEHATGIKKNLARKQKLDLNQLLNTGSDDSEGSVIAPKLHLTTVQRKIIPKLEPVLPIKDEATPSTKGQLRYKKSKSGPCHLVSENQPGYTLDDNGTKVGEDVSVKAKTSDENSKSKSVEDLTSRKSYLRDLTAQLRRRHASTPHLIDLNQEINTATRHNTTTGLLPGEPHSERSDNDSGHKDTNGNVRYDKTISLPHTNAP